MYEFALRQGNSQSSLPIAQPFKLVYAMYLADMGMVDTARRYVEGISRIVKDNRKQMNAGNSSLFSNAFLHELSVFEDRIGGTSGDKRHDHGRSGSSWLGSLTSKLLGAVVGSSGDGPPTAAAGGSTGLGAPSGVGAVGAVGGSGSVFGAPSSSHGSGAAVGSFGHPGAGFDAPVASGPAPSSMGGMSVSTPSTAPSVFQGYTPQSGGGGNGSGGYTTPSSSQSSSSYGGGGFDPSLAFGGGGSGSGGGSGAMGNGLGGTTTGGSLLTPSGGAKKEATTPSSASGGSVEASPGRRADKKGGSGMFAGIMSSLSNKISGAFLPAGVKRANLGSSENEPYFDAATNKWVFPGDPDTPPPPPLAPPPIMAPGGFPGSSTPTGFPGGGGGGVSFNSGPATAPVGMQMGGGGVSGDAPASLATGGGGFDQPDLRAFAGKKRAAVRSRYVDTMNAGDSGGGGGGGGGPPPSGPTSYAGPASARPPLPGAPAAPMFTVFAPPPGPSSEQ